MRADWKTYAFGMLLFNVLGIVLTYAILRTQGIHPPLNPQGFDAPRPISRGTPR